MCLWFVDGDSVLFSCFVSFFLFLLPDDCVSDYDFVL